MYRTGLGDFSLSDIPWGAIGTGIKASFNPFSDIPVGTPPLPLPEGAPAPISTSQMSSWDPNALLAGEQGRAVGMQAGLSFAGGPGGSTSTSPWIWVAAGAGALLLLKVALR